MYRTTSTKCAAPLKPIAPNALLRVTNCKRGSFDVDRGFRAFLIGLWHATYLVSERAALRFGTGRSQVEGRRLEARAARGSSSRAHASDGRAVVASCGSPHARDPPG